MKQGVFTQPGSFCDISAALAEVRFVLLSGHILRTCWIEPDFDSRFRVFYSVRACSSV